MFISRTIIALLCKQKQLLRVNFCIQCYVLGFQTHWNLEEKECSNLADRNLFFVNYDQRTMMKLCRMFSGKATRHLELN